MIKAFKYRLYPTGKQEETLLQTLTICRNLYNTALQHRRDAYKKVGKSISYKEQANELPALKKELPEYQTVQSGPPRGQVLQDVLKRVDKAFKSFFRRIKQGETAVAAAPGYPRFQGKDRYHSFTYPQSGFRITTAGNRIEPQRRPLSKIGMVHIKMHRAIPETATIKTCTIKKEGVHWYCTLSCELPKPVNKQSIGSAVGIDLGLESFATISDGTAFDNRAANRPHHLKQSEQRLKALQQKYSVHKGKATKRKLSALHRKVANQRKDRPATRFLHKLSASLVKQYDAIFYEDLKIKEMIMANAYHLEKSIHDAGWRMFTHMLVYKAEEGGGPPPGKQAVKVNPKAVPRRDTSQRCSNCDKVVKKGLYQRKHECPECNYVTHRDHNAAQNILKLGTSCFGSPIVRFVAFMRLAAEATGFSRLVVHSL